MDLFRGGILDFFEFILQFEIAHELQSINNQSVTVDRELLYDYYLANNNIGLSYLFNNEDVSCFSDAGLGSPYIGILINRFVCHCFLAVAQNEYLLQQVSAVFSLTTNIQWVE